MKALGRILTVLQILLLGGAAILFYLCRQYMGVARYILYLTRKWQGIPNLDMLFFTLIALFLVYACWQILWRRHGRQALPLLAMSLFTLGFMLVFHGGGLRPYYQMLLIFDAVLLLQILKALINSKNHLAKEE